MLTNLACASIVQTSGVYLRDDGTYFSTSMKPTSVASKKKINVVAVCHPALGWCG